MLCSLSMSWIFTYGSWVWNIRPEINGGSLTVKENGLLYLFSKKQLSL